MNLEKEFTWYKAMKIFNHSVNKIMQYNRDLGIVEISEFSKLPEDRITAQADNYVTRLINENRLDTEFAKIMNNV